jgi:iron complex outermembrane recepter protein
MRVVISRRRRCLAAPPIASAIALAIGLLSPPRALRAQARPDSAAVLQDSSGARRLERMIIGAVRGPRSAPISETSITQKSIESRYFGQDVPLLLQGAAPSLTAYAETGNYWGYSYIRLRGIDQSRINLTIDGTPLNDPEDQVLYFADFPDLANSLGSVQVQRGAGTSSSGTASIAGSVNMETVPLATTARGTEVQLAGGSFGSRRGSVEYASGLLPSRFSFYGRVSALHTDGYREHSGVEGRSAFVSAGYFGDRDIVKFTATAGLMRDTMAYLAVPDSILETDRRYNPLTKRERDGFGERLAALSFTRLLDASSSISTTVYRIAASGNYDVEIDSLWNFNLDFTWYGVTSAWSYRRDALSVDIGVNGNTYARDHYVYVHPDLSSELYRNTGHKQDGSAFARVAYVAGRATLFSDVQGRQAEFRYSPDANAGIAGRSIAWAFLNPKAGVTVQLSAPFALYASVGRTTREPARNDMLAGFDNLDDSNVDFVGAFDRVKPERVTDVEAGATFRSASLDLQANAYSMDFRNEIAPIGALSYIGTPLRKNVGASYRRGLELDATLRAVPRVVFGLSAAASMNRIRSFTDSSSGIVRSYVGVEPLLTPHLLSSQRIQGKITRDVDVAVEGRYQSRSFLQNSGDSHFILPASQTLDASIDWRRGRRGLSLRANNLTNSKKFGSGYVSGDVSNYYVLPTRNYFVTATLGF